MIRDYTQEELETRYKKLPQPLKDALFNPDIAYAIFDTGKKHGMTIDQIGSIADETGYVIAGFTRPSEFIGNLQERLEVSSDIAREIALEINHAVFMSLHEILKNAHQIDINDEEFVRSAATAAQKPISSPEVPQRPTPPPAPRPAAPPPAIPHIPVPAPLPKHPPIFTLRQTPKPQPASLLPPDKILAAPPPPMPPKPPPPPPALAVKPPPPPAPPSPPPPTQQPIKKPMETPPPKKVFVELKDLEEDEIEAEEEEESERTTAKDSEEKEEIFQPEEPLVPTSIPASPLPASALLKEQDVPKKDDRQVPSWIREQEKRKTLQKPQELRETRFTLDLRNKKPLPEQESATKNVKETVNPQAVAPSEQKPQPAPAPDKRPQTQRLPSSDPYREPI